MREIERKMALAVIRMRRFKRANTEVSVENGVASVYLHGNNIYQHDTRSGETLFSLCGWNTPTTRSRLEALGIRIRQRHFSPYFINPYLSEQQISSYDVYNWVNGRIIRSDEQHERAAEEEQEDWLLS